MFSDDKNSPSASEYNSIIAKANQFWHYHGIRNRIRGYGDFAGREWQGDLFTGSSAWNPGTTVSTVSPTSSPTQANAAQMASFLNKVLNHSHTATLTYGTVCNCNCNCNCGCTRGTF